MPELWALRAATLAAREACRAFELDVLIPSPRFRLSCRGDSQAIQAQAQSRIATARTFSCRAEPDPRLLPVKIRWATIAKFDDIGGVHPGNCEEPAPIRIERLLEPASSSTGSGLEDGLAGGK